MFGVDRRGRGAARRSAHRSAAAAVGGRRRSTSTAGESRVTPLPFTPGGPMLAYGGGTEVAARRAGRLGMFFIAETHDAELEAAYLAEAERGRRGADRLRVPDGRHAAHGVRRRRSRQGVGRDRRVHAGRRGELRRSGTRTAPAPRRCRSRPPSTSSARSAASTRSSRPPRPRRYVARGVPLALQPLVGGIPPDIAWRYLEAAAAVTAPSS